jgi:hypothetical protein
MQAVNLLASRIAIDRITEDHYSRDFVLGEYRRSDSRVLQRERLQVELFPAQSNLDETWATLRLDT